MNKELPERKRNRLRNFDYSSVGIYFLTICTAERRNYFWSNLNVGACIARPQNAEMPSINVGATIGRPQPIVEIKSPEDIELSDWGKIVDEAITNIPNIYPAILVEKYVIMPDHIHLLLHICADEYGRPMVAPTMSRVVQQMKGYVTKRIGVSVWQKLFFDHVIRNRRDYEEHVKYIYNNPRHWYLDELYSKGRIK